MEGLNSYAKKPGMYPYRRPDGDYLMVGDDSVITRIFFQEDIFDPVMRFESGQASVNDLLYSMREEPLENRIPVLFYGSKANPADMHGCLSRHGASTTVPAYNGRTVGFDVVHAAYVSEAGSIPAHIVNSDETETEAWLHLLDDRQVLAVNDTEKVREGNYFLGRLPFRFRGGKEITAYAYLGDRHPTYFENESPVALASCLYESVHNGFSPGFDFVPVNSFNRRYPERNQKEMLELFDGEVLMSPEGGLLHIRPGELSMWGRANLGKANDILAERFGRHITPDVERVDNCYETGSLKRLRDLV